MQNFEALDVYLRSINAILSKEGIAEISINKPNEAWVEKFGEMYRVELPGYDLKYLKR